MANNSNRRRGGYGFGLNLTGPGTMFTMAFIALAIGMGVILSRGVTPRSTLSGIEESDTEYEMVLETPKPGEKGLQLKTLKFVECASTVTVDLLLDKSGSMGDPTPSGVRKIDRLKDAVLSLIQSAKDTSIIGIQSFNSSSIDEDVAISFYKDVKGIVPAKVAALEPRAYTPTHDALAFAYTKLEAAVKDVRFKDRKFNLIFISDGAPCPGKGCTQPGVDQDPYKFTPNPVNQIKDLGVNIFSLGIFGANQQDPALAKLLQDIASKPENYYAASTGDDVKLLLKQINNKICAAEPTPTP